MTIAYITHPACRLHDMGAAHPESPARLAAIEDQLLASGFELALRRYDAPAVSREQLQRVTRETDRQTRDSYLGVLAEISRVQALQQAVASARTALDATQAGFDVGTRTIVDVLLSQRNLYQSITNYYQARYDYLLNVLRLKQAGGTLQVQDLELIDKWLVERRTPEEVFADEAASESGS